MFIEEMPRKARERLMTIAARPARAASQIEKKAMEASAIMIVANQPMMNIGRGSVSRPIMRGFMAITIITAIRGAARRPFTTALQ
jgi:hypothetical protein